MVDSSSATMIPLPLHLTHKIISSFKDGGVKLKGSKSGKDDDEKSFNIKKNKMVDSSSATMIPLPLHLTHKIISSFKDGGVKLKGSKSGKDDDEKSFNRYVRQLVDQYLDKEIVISKQPEDKVELIVQACRERFPEYAHWTTTRIRIYIESCRRLKKIKGSPILLAKRKAAGRRFREGQRLKKMLTSQLSVQSNESHRQLAEYLLKGTTSPPPLKSTIPSPVTMISSGVTGMDTSESPVKSEPDQLPIISEAMQICGPLSQISPVSSASPPLVTSLPMFVNSLPNLTPAVIGSMMQLQNSLTSPPTLLASRTSPPPPVFTSCSPPLTGSPLQQPLKISPLRPTITLPESPTSLLSQVDTTCTAGTQNTTTTRSPSLSPKQKSFQIDSLIMKCDKKKPSPPPISSNYSPIPPPTISFNTSIAPQILDQPIFSSGQEMSMSEIVNAKTLIHHVSLY
eukprot:sb/3464570/